MCTLQSFQDWDDIKEKERENAHRFNSRYFPKVAICNQFDKVAKYFSVQTLSYLKICQNIIMNSWFCSYSSIGKFITFYFAIFHFSFCSCVSHFLPFSFSQTISNLTCDMNLVSLCSHFHWTCIVILYMLCS